MRAVVVGSGLLSASIGTLFSLGLTGFDGGVFPTSSIAPEVRFLIGSSLVGYFVTAFIMLVVTIASPGLRTGTGFAIWSWLVGAFLLGCIIGLAHFRLDARAFRAEAGRYVAHGGRDHYQRVQWWPREHARFLFTYPNEFRALD